LATDVLPDEGCADESTAALPVELALGPPAPAAPATRVTGRTRPTLAPPTPVIDWRGWDQTQGLMRALLVVILEPVLQPALWDGRVVSALSSRGHGADIKLPGALFNPRAINPHVERLFWGLVAGHTQPIRQVCINFWNMEPLDLQPKLFGDDAEFQRRELHHALEQIKMQFGKHSIKSGTRLLLEKEAAHLVSNKPKCPFIPQREMELKMGKITEEVLDVGVRGRIHATAVTPCLRALHHPAIQVQLTCDSGCRPTL
jgi:hypothetical protein